LGSRVMSPLRSWLPRRHQALTGDDSGTHRSTHDLQRANATGLVAEEVDIKTAQAMLGHSNVQLTDGLYAQAVVNLGAPAAESMAARFRLAGSDKPRDGRAMDPGEVGEDGERDGGATR